MKSRYDVVILGLATMACRGDHPGALGCVFSEKNNYFGGATTSQKVFPRL
jgi:hypothetical protein